MDLSRRGFMQLLGLGAAGTLANPVIAPLFGSDEVKAEPLIRPGKASGLGHHLVYYSTRGSVAPSAGELSPFTSSRSALGKDFETKDLLIKHPGVTSGPVRKAEPTAFNGDYDLIPAPTRWPDSTPPTNKIEWQPAHSGVRTPQNLGHDYALPNEVVISLPYVEGMDPHAAFYKAALELRRRFTEQSRQLLHSVHPTLRPKARLVTRIYNEIYARPQGTMSGRHFDDEQDRGFEVVADYETTIMMSDPQLHQKGVHIYSQTGEYPIDIPSEIEMALLMRIDREIFAQPKQATRRGFFRLWRP